MIVQAGIVLLAVALVWTTIKGQRDSKRLKELENAYDSLAVVARDRGDSLAVVRRRTAALLDAQRRQIDSLVAAIPVTPPSPAPGALRETLDTAQIAASLRAQIEEVLAYTAALEVERDSLRAFARSVPARLAARDSLWVEQLVAADSALVAERRARALLEDAFEELHHAQQPGWVRSLACGVGGAAVGSLLDPAVAGVTVGAFAGVGACTLFR